MVADLRHRGPDANGVWSDDDQLVHLGHTRLAVVDLTETGSQPMTSASGRLIAVYNGEVYNFKALRLELEAYGIRFRGHSDTEVVVEAIEYFGADVALSRFCGMFALGIWDRRSQELLVARDNIGIKPVYYCWAGTTFVFASELRPLRRIPGFDESIDPAALSDYFRLSCIPAPSTIYRGARKLLPGHVLRINAKTLHSESSAPFVTAHAQPSSMAAIGSENLESLLRRIVREQLVADVPVGTFLSGGVDSSLVTALAVQESGRPVHTFSIGVDDSGFDERVHARAIARQLGTRHIDALMSESDVLDMVAGIPRIYGEPFADSSQLPTLFVSQLARKHVTVALSGDGGDELFGGYNRHVVLPELWARIHRIPHPLRRFVGAILRATPASLLDLGRHLLRDDIGQLGRNRFGQNLHKVGLALGARTIGEMYLRLISHTAQAPSPLASDWVRTRDDDHFILNLPAAGFADAMMGLDLAGYLPDDILTKVDRASMACSLEVRVPLLDQRVVHKALSIPSKDKIAARIGKLPLRSIANSLIPGEHFSRAKAGFAIPLDRWLRGGLRAWAEDLLSEQALQRSGILDTATVRAMWNDHVSGRRERHYQLWDVLMFQSWFDSEHARCSQHIERQL